MYGVVKVAEDRLLMAASCTLRNSGGDKARSMSITRKLSTVGVPMAHICSFRVRRCSDVSVGGVDGE